MHELMSVRIIYSNHKIVLLNYCIELNESVSCDVIYKIQIELQPEPETTTRLSNDSLPRLGNKS